MSSISRLLLHTVQPSGAFQLAMRPGGLALPGPDQELIIVGSASHNTPETQEFVSDFKARVQNSAAVAASGRVQRAALGSPVYT